MEVPSSERSSKKVRWESDAGSAEVNQNNTAMLIMGGYDG